MQVSVKYWLGLTDIQLILTATSFPIGPYQYLIDT